MKEAPVHHGNRAISITLVSDSLATSMVPFTEGHCNFDWNYHHSNRRIGLSDKVNYMKDLINFAYTYLTQQYASETEFFDAIHDRSVSYVGAVRNGLALAHYSPLVKKDKVSAQMYMPKFLDGIQDLQTDLVIICLGANDCADYNSIAVEEFLKLIVENDEVVAFQEQLNSANLDPELKERINKGLIITQYFKNKGEQVNDLGFDEQTKEKIFEEAAFTCVGVVNFSRAENEQICQFVNSIQYPSENITEYVRDWDERKYRNKTPEEIFAELDAFIAEFKDHQHQSPENGRMYPVEFAFMLPPSMEDPSNVGWGRMMQPWLEDIRATQRAYAEDHGIKVIDLNDVHLPTNQPVHDINDHVHLAKEFAEYFSKSAILLDVVLSNMQNRIRLSVAEEHHDNLKSFFEKMKPILKHALSKDSAFEAYECIRSQFMVKSLVHSGRVSPKFF